MASAKIHFDTILMNMELEITQVIYRFSYNVKTISNMTHPVNARWFDDEYT